jgi:hypothetical protein
VDAVDCGSNRCGQLDPVVVIMINGQMAKLRPVSCLPWTWVNSSEKSIHISPRKYFLALGGRGPGPADQKVELRIVRTEHFGYSNLLVIDIVRFGYLSMFFFGPWFYQIGGNACNGVSIAKEAVAWVCSSWNTLQHSSVMYTVPISVVDVVMFSVTRIRTVCLELCLERGKLDLMGIYGV